MKEKFGRYSILTPFKNKKKKYQNYAKLSYKLKIRGVDKWVYLQKYFYRELRLRRNSHMQVHVPIYKIFKPTITFINKT